MVYLIIVSHSLFDGAPNSRFLCLSDCIFDLYCAGKFRLLEMFFGNAMIQMISVLPCQALILFY